MGDIEIKRVFPGRAVFIMQDCVCKEEKTLSRHVRRREVYFCPLEMRSIMHRRDARPRISQRDCFMPKKKTRIYFKSR